jgi:sugar phosphate isomerase/epimerase
MGEYTIKNEYQGGFSTLDPTQNEYFTGYQASAGSLGLTSDPRATFKLSSDVSTKLSSGAKHIELAMVSPEFFDNTPKQELKEVNRLAKLTGASISVHAPVIDTTGTSREGWSEVNREMAETKMKSFVERSHGLDPTGNTTVVFHSAEGIAGSSWEKLGDKDTRRAKRLIAVSREDGRSIALEKEKLYYPDLDEDLKPEIREKLISGKMSPDKIDEKRDYQKYDLDKGKIYTPEQRISSQNRTIWDNEMKKIEFERESAEKTLRNVNAKFREAYLGVVTGRIDPSNLTAEEMNEVKKIRFAAEHMEEASQNLNSSFSKAYKIAKETNNQEHLKILNNLSKEYKKNLGYMEKNPLKQRDPQVQSNAMGEMVKVLKEVIPEQLTDIESWAVGKSSKTFGNTAFYAYEKYGDKAPIIAIENPPAGFGLSTGEDLKNLVIASREEFANKLVEEKGMDKGKAKKTAEKFIGATWDVGHINMLRAQGFSEKDIIKESERIAPYVKHVHLSDNFGLEHTELPMGMGNVPMKEIMKKLGQKGYDAKKIIEAGQWWQTMQRPPIKESLEGLGSSFYVGGGPTWAQSTGLYQGYNEGLVGQWLPQTNYETFGTGFSQLPQELGGDRAGGAGGRMGGGRM